MSAAARRITLAALAIAGSLGAAPAGAETVTVFAAASLTDAMTAVADAFTAATGGRVVLSFAASSTLARQIENGAPASLYVSASTTWMDRLDAAGLLAAGKRVDLLGNRLVLVAPADVAVAVAVDDDLDLAALLDGGRLAVADPDHVPAGLYAKAALQSLGLWGGAEPRLARTGDVRAALVLVARGEAPLGIVYRTDAINADRVREVGRFPADSHPPIVYPAAVVGEFDGAPADAFFRYLQGDEAGGIFAGFGFTVMVRGGSAEPN